FGGDREHLLVGREGREERVGAGFGVRDPALDGVLERAAAAAALDVELVAAGDDHEVVVLTAVGRGGDARLHVGDREPRPGPCCVLGGVRVLDVYAGYAGAVVVADRAVDVGDGLAGLVGVDDQRDLDRLGDVAGDLDHLDG